MNMNEPGPFRWTVVLLDDAPNAEWLPKSVKKLVEAGLNCKVVTTLHFDANNVALFQVTDLFVVDMQWLGYEKYVASPAPLDLGSSLPWTPNRVQNWIATIGAALFGVFPSPGPEVFPRAKIEVNDVGLWLGALFLRMQPYARLVFFTAKDSVKDNSTLGALQVYPRSAFKVQAKDTRESLGLDSLAQDLEALQRRALQRRPDLREWVRRDLILKSLLGAAPGEIIRPTLHSTGEKLVFKAELFFPQFACQNGTMLSRTLANLVPKEAPISEWEVILLEDIFHGLDRIETVVPSDKKLQKLKDACESLGRKGKRILPFIEELRYEPNLAQNAKTARGFVRQTLKANCTALSEFITDQKHCEGVFVCGGCGDRVLPFSLLDLNDVILVLCRNTEKYGGSSGTISAQCSDQGIELTWSDDSSGFGSRDEFDRKVVTSFEKGFYRGIPLALEFAIKYGAERLWIRVGPCWTDLLDSSACEKTNTFTGFGMRIVFA